MLFDVSDVIGAIATGLLTDIACEAHSRTLRVRQLMHLQALLTLERFTAILAHVAFLDGMGPHVSRQVMREQKRARAQFTHERPVTGVRG